MSLDVSPGYPPPSAPPPPPPAPPSGPPPPIYPQYGYVPGGPSPVAKTSGRAVAALVLALVSIFVPFVLVPAVLLLGALALSQISRTPFLRGRGMAISAIVITLASAVGWAALVAATDEPTGTGTGTAGRPATENVVAAVGRACRGRAVPEAGAYRGDGPFHLVLARDNGRPMTWSAREARWRADEVADTELVACIAEQSNLIETCPYWNGPDISRYETVMTVRLVTARQGRPVSTFQVRAQPRQCRSSELMSTVRLDGEVTFPQLSQRLGLASLAPAAG